MRTLPDNVIPLQRYPGSPAAGIRMPLENGRFEVVTNGPNAEFDFAGSDPYKTNAYTGLVVPSAASASIGGARYLFLLARAAFTNAENNALNQGARLVGIRQYAELVAHVPGRTTPLASNAGPASGATVTFRKEITSPLWHPADGNISWHVMVRSQGYRDHRNPLNSDGFVYQQSDSPALLFQTTGPYVPPNGGRPWGAAIGASLGNIHELRYPWRSHKSEYALDIPIPAPCIVELYASVRQPDTSLNPVFDSEETDCALIGALSPEDQFVAAFPTYAKYGVIAGALVFDQNIGEDVP